MLIHIETKRRWNITISTSRHSPANKRTGPGASPCTCSCSTFATPVGNSKVPSSSRYPRDTAEEDPSSGDTATIFRCRTFLRKIYRLSVRVHQMYAQPHAEVVREEPPPPYEHQHGHELSAASIHELPDGRMLAPELAGHHVLAELESPLELANEHPFTFETDPASYSDLSETNERGAAAVLQPFTTAEATMLLWDLNTKHHFASASSMMGSGQSFESSPISPVTPDVEGSRLAQLLPDASLAAGIVSPLEGAQSYDIYWPGLHQMDTFCGYPSHMSLPTSLVTSPMETFRRNAQYPQAEHNQWQNDPLRSPIPFGFASHPSHVPSTQSSFGSGHSLPESHSQWHDTTGIRLGTYERCERRGWQFCGAYEQDTTQDEDTKHAEVTVDERGSSQHAHRFGDCPRSLTNFVELDDQQAPQLCVAPEEDEVDYPLELCSQCDKTFSGRYRKGNMRRHVLAFHNRLAAAVGSACRMCTKTYKRADATRKHEWKTHGMPDAKPKKRANASRQP